MEQLSNYELLDLLTTYGSDGAGHFMNFLSVFSAYLVAGYVLAGKLGRPTLVLLSALYVFVVAMTATGQYVNQLVAIDLGNEIAARQMVLGPNAATVAKLLSGASGEFVKFLSPAIQLLACVGSIVFAFHHRRKSIENDGA